MGRNQPHRYNIQTPTQMAVIKTIEKGESLTFGFVLPDTYNLANLQSVKIYIGSTVYAHTMDIRTIRVELESNETALLTGRNILHCVLDDAIWGIKKHKSGELEVLPTQATHKDESVSTEYDFLIPLTITETIITQGTVIYNAIKGDTGAAGTIDVGTVETGDAGTNVIVENVGTPSEAILNFTIPKGDAGDFFVGQFNTVIDKLNIVWVDGWVHIVTDGKMTAKIVDVGYMAINTGQGMVQLKPIVHYPSATSDSSAAVPNGFYVKDTQNLLAENTDFETLDIRYNVSNDTVSKYDGKTFRIEKENVAFDDYSESHSAAMAAIFMDIYPDFAGTVYRSCVDELTPSTRIDSYFEAEYARIRKLNIIAVPISNASTVESSGSNPDILKIASHYDNTFTRHDITANATTFLRNVIAETSGPDEENRTTGCTYGYGVEFFEDNVKTSDVYPDYVYNNWNPIYQQSATSAIIMAKFRMIQDLSGANWHICRLAARATAEKTVGGIFASGYAWDMYRGFGIINVADAVQYIEDNYKSLEYRAMLADQHDGLNGISPFITYPDFLPDSPLPKHIIEEQFVAKETGKSIIADTEIAKLEDYPTLLEETNNQLISDTGEFIPIPVAAGGANANLFFSNVDSEVDGMKTLSYTADAEAVELADTVTTADGDKLIGEFIYGAGVAATMYPAGNFTFNFFGRVSLAAGDTYIGARYFKYSVGGVKTYIFPEIAWSNPIKNTDNGLIQVAYTTTESAVTDPTDRMGCSVYLKRESAGTRTVTVVLGDGSASYLSNPNLLRHNQTRAINGDAAYQHLDTTTEKVTPIDADSAGIWDSVAGKFVRTTLANFKAFLKTYFDTLYASLAGATFTGEVSTITGGLKAAKIYPNANSTTAIQITKADKTTAILNVDTTNSRVAINTASAEDSFHIKTPNQGYLLFGGSNGRTMRARNADGSAGNFDLTGGIYISGGIECGSNFQLRFGAAPVMLRQDGGASYLSGGTFGVGVTAPKSRIHANGAVQVANDTDAASVDKVGAIRYRADANNSYMEMCMQTGASTYEWFIIKQNTW